MNTPEETKLTKPVTETPESTGPLLREIDGCFGHNSFIDLWSFMAHQTEKALRQSGAVPGKDYSALDLFKLAQPFVLERYRKGELSDCL